MVEKELIDSKELAVMLSVSKKYVEAHRHSIAGSQRVGRLWRFNLKEIRQRIATGRDIIEK